jgi:hypothetical protein
MFHLETRHESEAVYGAKDESSTQVSKQSDWQRTQVVQIVKVGLSQQLKRATPHKPQQTAAFPISRAKCSLIPSPTARASVAVSKPQRSGEGARPTVLNVDRVTVGKPNSATQAGRN